MKVLIIEDEPRAAGRLEKLILRLLPKSNIVAKPESIRDALDFLEAHHDTELIFADIQLADGLCFEIFDKVKITCPIIFTTAYDQYAIEAFNTNGIDYLLKPIEEERLKQALEKVKNFTPVANIDRILSLISEKSLISKKNKSRFIVRVGEKIKTISTHDIKVFYSFDRATYILTQTNHNYIIDYSLDQLENLLDTEQYFRVNRKYIVSLAACNQIYSWSNSRLKIEVQGLPDEIVVARERVNKFKDWLDE